MRPALSILLFTTLSGSGLGLLAWLGFVLGFVDEAIPSRLLWPATVTGLVLTAAGLLCSLGHLGHPERAWRAVSQWRSSWLSREGVLALLLFPLALGTAWLSGTQAGIWLSIAGVLLLLLSVATLFATAMIYASLRTVAAWAMPLVPAGFLAWGLLGGWLWLWTVLAVAGVGLGSGAVATAVLAGIALVVVKASYWRQLRSQLLPGSNASALGLLGQVPGEARVDPFEAPHTEANYITREMVFVFARRHAPVLQLGALVLGAAWPVTMLLLAWAWPGIAAVACVLGVIGFQAGAFLERWLFFAQARHVVARYYPTSA